jgi:hypothetical protein
MGALGSLTYSYATHHRHSCIGARAGFGDLLIGAGPLMAEANGFDPGEHANLLEPMVELIKITEGFFACGVASSVYGAADRYSATFMPEPVFANIGKLLLSTQIYDMHRSRTRSRRADRRPARAGRRPQPGDGGDARRGPAREPGGALRQAHRGGTLHRGPHGVLSRAAGTRSSACTGAARRRR